MNPDPKHWTYGSVWNLLSVCVCWGGGDVLPGRSADGGGDVQQRGGGARLQRVPRHHRPARPAQGLQQVQSRTLQQKWVNVLCTVRQGTTNQYLDMDVPTVLVPLMLFPDPKSLLLNRVADPVGSGPFWSDPENFLWIHILSVGTYLLWLCKVV